MTGPKKRRTRRGGGEFANTAKYGAETKKGRHGNHADLLFTSGSETRLIVPRSCGSRIRTDDLEVMSLASYRAAPSRTEVIVDRFSRA